MGKTPKKAAPGGDERNLYVRRLKATNAPSKTETSLPERQRDSENSNRPKLSGVQKKIATASSKNFKSKLRTPTKFGPNPLAKRINKLPGVCDQSSSSLEFAKPSQSAVTNMQPESEEAENKLNVPAQKENTKDEFDTNGNQGGESNLKESIEPSVGNETVPYETQSALKAPEKPETLSTEKQPEAQEDENVSLHNSSTEMREKEDQEDSDIKLTFEAEDSPVKLQDGKVADKEQQNEEKTEQLQSTPDTVKSNIKKKDDSQCETQMDTESCSVDIVESTSEISETSESVSDVLKEKEQEKEKESQTAKNDATFVSYDSSIMLKDVQIKLNDCLKESSKLADLTNGEQSTPDRFSHDASFGKTLRNISGRHSLGRMRHVTLREHRPSPNSSLFVNTSSASLVHDETGDCKVLHYNRALSDAYPTNGSPLERKRKLDSEGWNSAKKSKIDSESSLLNTSISLLKGLRKPIQVSTPNVTGYKFRSEKLDISGISNDDEKAQVDQTEGIRKWCIIM